MEEDLPEVDQVEATKVARAVAASSPTAAAIVREHVNDNDEVLPTVLLADVARWFRRQAHDSSDDVRRDLDRGLQAIAHLYDVGDESMQTIVATGFLEAMPHPDEAGREVVDLLPPSLREELRAMEGADPAR